MGKEKNPGFHYSSLLFWMCGDVTCIWLKLHPLFSKKEVRIDASRLKKLLSEKTFPSNIAGSGPSRKEERDSGAKKKKKK